MKFSHREKRKIAGIISDLIDWKPLVVGFQSKTYKIKSVSNKSPIVKFTIENTLEPPHKAKNDLLIYQYESMKINLKQGASTL